MFSSCIKIQSIQKERQDRNLKAITEKIMDLYRHRHPHIGSMP